jgi:hypothetical protein
VALGRAWRNTEVVRVSKRNDKVAIAVIWLLVLIGALLIGVGSSDPGVSEKWLPASASC